ncbi:MAG: hypothetical protein HON98_13585 [Chloroflexi bacterium]|mgnify:CR=1 FL=1|nr:hypothetical protein [Chloroflexota bacterium]MBT3671109.1 hypothetical protein [Chloroflexota bacterium]MBT4003311.1 hypothetical protein [Chloroflexota bacterium]MBT4304924.1 hypothetical protein [Chloroflexota bacterium]MBT4533988.1 hypothetical protein [Chloroflexota bacterium]
MSEFVLWSKGPILLIGILLFQNVLLTILIGSFWIAANGFEFKITLMVGFLLLIIFFIVLFIPTKEKFVLNKNKQIFAHKRIYLTSKLGFPAPKVVEYEFSRLSFLWGYKNAVKNHNQLIIEKSDQKNGLTEKRFELSTKEKDIVKIAGWLEIPLNVNAKGENETLQIPGKKHLSNIGKYKSPELIESKNLEIIDEINVLKNDSSQTDILNQKMLNRIASWGRSSLILGTIHLLFSGYLAPSWGIILITVGLASFVFKEAAMFVVYAVSLGWVGINNITSPGLGGWTIFGLYQLFLALQIYRSFKQYNLNEVEYLEKKEGHWLEDERPGKANKFFPAMGCGLSSLSLFLFVGGLVGLIGWMSFVGDVENLNFLDLILDSLLGFGVIGIAVSLASLLSKFRLRWMSLVGLILGVLLIFVSYGIMFL